MQLDLALFLRLSRTLESIHSLSQLVSEDQEDILRAMDRLFLTVGERTELLRTREVVQPSAEMEVEVEELEGTREVPEEKAEPDPHATAAFEAISQEEEPPPVWSQQHDLLYEDILWLFKVGDNEGALASLGRLLHVAEETSEMQRFLEINEPKLVGLYERILGSFKLPLVVSGNGLGDRFFWSVEAAQEILRLGREVANLEDLIKRSSLSRMKTLALVHRMHTEGLLTLQQEKLQ